MGKCFVVVMSVVDCANKLFGKMKYRIPKGRYAISGSLIFIIFFKCDGPVFFRQDQDIFRYIRISEYRENGRCQHAGRQMLAEDYRADEGEAPQLAADKKIKIKS